MDWECVLIVQPSQKWLKIEGEDFNILEGMIRQFFCDAKHKDAVVTVINWGTMNWSFTGSADDLWSCLDKNPFMDVRNWKIGNIDLNKVRLKK